MAKSRYSDTQIIDKKYYETQTFPRHPSKIVPLDVLSGIQTFDHVVSQGERLDHISSRYFGVDEYWWVIAYVNGIDYPFSSGGVTPGRVIRIPSDVDDVMRRLLS